MLWVVCCRPRTYRGFQYPTRVDCQWTAAGPPSAPYFHPARRTAYASYPPARHPILHCASHRQVRLYTCFSFPSVLCSFTPGSAHTHTRTHARTHAVTHIHTSKCLLLHTHTHTYISMLMVCLSLCVSVSVSLLCWDMSIHN